MAKNALGYRPKQASKVNPQGIARIVVGNSKAKITFMDTGNEDYPAPTFDNGEHFKEFALKDLPRVPRLTTGERGEYFVKLDKDAENVEIIGPVLEKCSGYVVDLSRPNGKEAPPNFYLYTPKNPEFKPYNVFQVYVEIDSGKFKGVIVSARYQYKFTDDGEGAATWDGVPGAKNAKWLPRLQEMCMATDCVDEPIEWPQDGNILPELLDRMLSKHRKIQFLVDKKGYIDVDSIHAGFVEDEDDDVDKAFPAKAKANGKKAAKTPAKSAKKSKRDEF